MSVDLLKCSDLVLKIERPEYMASPEGLLSALAWQGLSLVPPPDSRMKVGLVFEGTPSGGREFQTYVSRPHRDDSGWQADFEWLKSAGMNLEGIDEGRQSLLLEGILNSVGGVKSEKSRTRAASPMSVNLALLQNPIGMVGKKGPAPYASILETMFTWGGARDSESAQSLWEQAVAHRLESDRLLRKIDSVAERLLKERLESEGIHRELSKKTVRRGGSLRNQFLNELEGTPYQWFYRSWKMLTSDIWVETLGPRIWTDWLTTVLRQGLAMGYLWECHYYYAVARAILGDSFEEMRRLLAEEMPLIPWVTASTTNTQRNVLPAIRDVVRKGNAVREFCGKSEEIQNLAAEFPDEPLVDHIDALRIPAVRDQLMQAMRKATNGRGGGARILHESIVYSLQERGETDYYALLKRIDSRNVVVTPGVEWVAMIASLACGRPGGETSLREMNRQLRQLGLQGPALDIVRLLETAGLATGSPDADEGVRITSAF